ncbi:DNA glycosylase AlkZ-like family protein [Pseudomonas lini]
MRSHYLPLFSRLGNYSSDLLDQAAWSQGRRRTLFEYWGHEASLLPLSMYPLMRWRMQRATHGEDIYQQLARFGRGGRIRFAAFWRRFRNLVRWVRAACRPGRSGLVRGGTGARKKHALEWLFAAGEVTVAGRRGFERLYDLPERVIPSAILQQPLLSEAEAQRGLLLHAATALGVGTEKGPAGLFSPEPGRQPTAAGGTGRGGGSAGV